MIYTCTLNPSLDYYMEFTDELSKETTNRSQLEYYEAGGKGINVSIVLNNLMIPSRALGFIGGFTKDFYINLLQKYEYIQPSFSYIDGHTRINVKIKANEESIDLNAAGPYITNKNMEQLVMKIERLDDNDILVFSGNSPDYLLDQVESMLKGCASEGVRVVLDTNPNIINSCLKYKPYLINPSINELEEITKMPCNSFEEIILAGKYCVNEGAKNVMIRLKEGSLLINSEGVYRSTQTETIMNGINTVGMSDAMVAGFVMSSLRTTKAIECFKFANSCSDATGFSKSLEIRDKINAIYDNIEIEKLEAF